MRLKIIVHQAKPGEYPSSPFAVIVLEYWTRDTDDNICLSANCTTEKELGNAIKRLKDELEAEMRRVFKQKALPK